jgi:hypothetical protein
MRNIIFQLLPFTPFFIFYFSYFFFSLNIFIYSYLFPLNRMIKLEKICHGQLAEGSFGNLTKLKVICCHSLRFMFSCSVVGSLSKLQEIDIRGCTGMSAIVAKESEEEIETNTMEFPQLRCLRIENVPRLKGFYSGVDSHSFFNEKVR